MNKCDKYREMISASLDGELSQVEEQALAVHLDECGECSKLTANLRGQHQLFDNKQQAKMPSELEAAILLRTRGHSKGVGLIGRLFSGSLAIPKPVAWAAAALITALAIYSGFMTPGRESIPSGAMTRSFPEKVQKVVITDRDIVRTQVISDKDKL